MQFIRVLLASAVLAAPLASQGPPAAQNTTQKPVTRAESLGASTKRPATKKAQPAKKKKATNAPAKATSLDSAIMAGPTRLPGRG